MGLFTYEPNTVTGRYKSRPYTIKKRENNNKQNSHLIKKISSDVMLLKVILSVTVRTRFVTTRNSVGFVRKKAQTISFVERGFERLGLGHQTAGLFLVFIHG